MTPPTVTHSGQRARVACRLLAAAGVVLTLGGPALASTPPDTTASWRSSTRNSPGWYPVVDPESMSVVIGRRLNAPIAKAPFRGGTRSLDALGRAVCRALHHGDVDSMRTLCVRENEFRDVMWREFPQSRPVTGLTWVDAWMILNARLSSGCNGAVADHGGRYLEFVRFEQAGVKRFKNFKLHDGLVLVARNDMGDIERFTWLRSVAERKGIFKIYSVDD